MDLTKMSAEDRKIFEEEYNRYLDELDTILPLPLPEETLVEIVSRKETKCPALQND
jgi:hypothetical protein